MSKLTDAQQIHDAAAAKSGAAIEAASAARAHAANLRQRVAAGAGDEVTATDLADADHAADHAELVSAGAHQALQGLGQAVQAARADEVCDRIVAELPALGSAVYEALDALASDLAKLVSAASDYDRFAEDAVHVLNTAGRESPRVKIGRFDAPSVDRLPLASCRGWSQLAAALVPVAAALGAHSNDVTVLQNVAQGAPTLPSTN
ncbi:MAG TPA: hypothetical protein VHU85_17855 [Acidimicrobiales bacterium]|jgi:hypothetical protein|nr:hypothetical protein [Acidimicrobiales bacterium]